MPPTKKERLPRPSLLCTVPMNASPLAPTKKQATSPAQSRRVRSVSRAMT